MGKPSSWMDSEWCAEGVRYWVALVMSTWMCRRLKVLRGEALRELGLELEPELELHASLSESETS